jgi:hypothetical protein
VLTVQTIQRQYGLVKINQYRQKTPKIRGWCNYPVFIVCKIQTRWR